MFSDFLFPLRNRKQLSKIRKDNLVSAAFRERLMLAVTAVNGCRYCSYFHTKQALKSGVADGEIRKLLACDVGSCPEDEIAALFYAQHWAETDGHPDAEALKKVEDAYGTEKVEAIHLLLRMIRLGNLMGNTWDYFIYRITFGRCRR
mgnify:CR=1 FL=1